MKTYRSIEAAQDHLATGTWLATGGIRADYGDERSDLVFIFFRFVDQELEAYILEQKFGGCGRCPSPVVVHELLPAFSETDAACRFHGMIVEHCLGVIDPDDTVIYESPYSEIGPVIYGNHSELHCLYLATFDAETRAHLIEGMRIPII